MRVYTFDLEIKNKKTMCSIDRTVSYEYFCPRNGKKNFIRNQNIIILALFVSISKNY